MAKDESTNTILIVAVVGVVLLFVLRRSPGKPSGGSNPLAGITSLVKSLSGIFGSFGGKAGDSGVANLTAPGNFVGGGGATTIPGSVRTSRDFDFGTDASSSLDDTFGDGPIGEASA